MNTALEKTKTILDSMGFSSAEVVLDEEHRKISIFIDSELIKQNTSAILPALDHVLNLILRKQEDQPYIVDLNHYRKERERIIIDLARAAAHKAMITKTDVELPPMNSYERRLVHMEISAHPELKTESIGNGKERRTFIKHVEL